MTLRIDCSRVRWDDIHVKESHPKKPLDKHIKEVKNFYEELRSLFRIYRIDDEIDLLIDLVIQYHDMGKLHPRWRVGKKGARHSEYSVLWLLCNRDSLNRTLNSYSICRNGFIKTLYMLIFKHHSTINLTPPSVKDHNLRKVFSNDMIWHDYYEYIKNLDFKDRIRLADLYGLFKIADILSADPRYIENRDILQSPTPIKVEDVKYIVSNGGIDKERWIEQIALKDLNNLALLRAYTGWGKTTASLLYTVDKEPVKIFYLLPTITAINKFYEKLRSSIGDRVGRFYYLYDAYLAIREGGELGEEIDRLHNLFYARHFLDKYINITTVDQLILSLLFIGRYYMKRFVFRESTIILDEIHLLNPVMIEIILKMVMQYQDIYKFNMLMMSASLPNNLRKYMEDKLDRNIRFLDYIEGYKKRRRVLYNIVDSDLSSPSSIDMIISDYQKGEGNILVLVNTVDKAIDIAKEISEELGGDNVVLLHSRMMYIDRLRKEELIENYIRNGYRHILISTQVAEVSLDISYDKLYTELAPLGSIIQRFGRVNRYGRWIDYVNAYIHIPSEIDAESRTYPYPKDEMLISLDILKELESDNLGSEYDLIKSYDDVESYDEYRERMYKELDRVGIDLFYNKSEYFYSLDLNEESIKKLLEYRGTFTILTLLDPDMIMDEDLREMVYEIINTDFTSLADDERNKLFAKLKSYLIPIPIYITKRFISQDRGFPIVNIAGYEYNSFLGLHRAEGGEIIG